GYQSVIIFDACATKDLSIYGIDVPAAQVHAAYMAGLNGLFAEVKKISDWKL
ncbi:MAG: cysteine hydrolase, partial [Gammaproteobacteria bacterium]|nr:cysteine hydrolase [Gammaproteobacteria bacterium]